MRAAAGRWVTAIRWTCYAGVLALLVAGLGRHRSEVAAGLAAAGPGRCLAAGLLAGAGCWLGMLGWRVLLASLGVDLPLRVAARLYFVPGLGKYVPGGIAPALGQADLARTLRLPPARIAVGFVLGVALSVVAGSVVGLLAVPRLASAHPAWWAVLPGSLAAVGAVLVLAAPRAHGRVLAAAGRLTRRAPGPVPGPGALARVVALMAGGWLLTGAHIAVLAPATGLAPGPALALAVGGYALAATAGTCAAVVPAGLGVREVVLALTLGSLVGGASLVAIVALSRLVTTGVDLLAAAGSAALRLPAPAPARPVPSAPGSRPLRADPEQVPPQAVTAAGPATPSPGGRGGSGAATYPAPR